MITPDRLAHLSFGDWAIVLHSSTDVPVAKALRVEPPDNLLGSPGQDDELEDEQSRRTDAP